MKVIKNKKHLGTTFTTCKRCNTTLEIETRADISPIHREKGKTLTYYYECPHCKHLQLIEFDELGSNLQKELQDLKRLPLFYP